MAEVKGLSSETWFDQINRLVGKQITTNFTLLKQDEQVTFELTQDLVDNIHKIIKANLLMTGLLQEFVLLTIIGLLHKVDARWDYSIKDDFAYENGTISLTIIVNHHALEPKHVGETGSATTAVN